MQLIDDNVIGMFYNNNFLGVVVLGFGFGVALTRLSKQSEHLNQNHTFLWIDTNASQLNHLSLISTSAT